MLERKIPPNKPNPIHEEVNIILITSIKSKE
jgi:hypothetical protein